MTRQMQIRSARDVGLAIAEARAVLGRTQADVAESVGIDRSYLARMEGGLSVTLLERQLRVLRRLGADVRVTLPDPSPTA